MYPQRVMERVAQAVTPGLGGCWISTYSRGSHGYAQVGWRERGRDVVTVAHRVAWAAASGRPIPDGMTVDHLCRVRACVRPSHLRLLSNVENARDNGQLRRGQPTPTGRSCRRGHDLLLYPSGAVACRECQRTTGKT